VQVRYPTPCEIEDRDVTPEDSDKILLFVNSEYVHDAAVTVEELLELRSEIDRFLFLKLGNLNGVSND
jgi:hypothetical protein